MAPPYPDTGGGGGGGGVGVQFSATGASFTNTGGIAGGIGGMAGAAVGAGGGGVGGTGGAGLVGAALSVINTGNIAGGTGGSGAVGYGGVLAPAGSGGAGVSLSAASSLDNRGIIRGGLGGGSGGAGGSGGGAGAILSGSSLSNTGSIIGGDGGSGGTLGGGAGIVGTDATVINNGTISGGLSNDGVTRANALTFLGGANTLIFGSSTPGLTGNIAIQAGTLTFDQSSDMTLSNVITGGGALIKAGLKTLVLNGQSTYTGPTTVNAGKLVVGDDNHAGASLASTVAVNGGGTLGGIGTIGGLAVANGGAVAPGNSIGTLNVAGNVSFAAGSIYQVETNAAGQSDRIVATGTASLTGGTVLALAQSGIFSPQTAYTILTANGGVTGTFADVSSSLIFLTPTLSYGANDVFLRFARSSTAFPDVAETPNQRAAAGGLQESSLTSPLVIAVLNQSAAGARQAFDALSGEVHASAQTAMIDDARYLREAVLGRLRQASFTGDAGPMAALTSGGPQLAASASPALAYAEVGKSAFPMKAPPAVPAVLPETAVWAQGVGAWGRLDGNGNAAGMTRDLAGFFSGVDHRFAPNWIVGIAGGYTSSTVRVSDRTSSADVETAHLAGYVGATYGALSLRGGAAASFSTLDTSRSIVFPNFFDTARARYDATTAQVFGEVGYGLTVGQVALEPFAGLAWVHLDTNSFNETGGSGIAALLGSGTKEDVGYSTLGARIATSFRLTNGMSLTPRASVAWQYALGDVTPTAALAFQSTGANFMVAGVPLARNAALVEGGLDLRVMPQASVGISYVGQLADRVQDHSVKGSFSWRF
ncbi:autotransporter domain-containing protein [Bradyrhizobium sp. Leo121]|uniref:autotransporter outer membrane beta-barrel domain-containing protein n=1 Tax=Bradyrhizobium sp. Leo121 TaxID=1571195 RepID=UPI00102A2B3A|nr:autotransporter domain-containing protein [Bradyrhizobium sp. Leo121]